MLPEIIGLKPKDKAKFEIEKYVTIKNNTLDKFKSKWAINCNFSMKHFIYHFITVICCLVYNISFL